MGFILIVTPWALNFMTDSMSTNDNQATEAHSHADITGHDALTSLPPDSMDISIR